MPVHDDRIPVEAMLGPAPAGGGPPVGDGPPIGDPGPVPGGAGPVGEIDPEIFLQIIQMIAAEDPTFRDRLIEALAARENGGGAGPMPMQGGGPPPPPMPMDAGPPPPAPGGGGGTPFLDRLQRQGRG
jgi:hypothetical protein